MNKPNVNSVKLKLERNKLNYEYDPLTETLTLGGTQNLLGYKVINILIPIVLGVTMITVGFIAVADIGLLELAGLISLLYGSYGITLVKKKAKNNASKKIIQPGSIQIIENNETTTLTSDGIESFNVNIQLVTKQIYEGVLELNANNKRYTILSLNEKRKSLLKGDLEYTKEFIEDLINNR